MKHKIKTHSGASKRFKKRGTSLIFKRANKNHMLTKKSHARKKRLSQAGCVKTCDFKRLMRLMYH
jgi:large subunit ribosomal protein L35